jgi:RNA polymerase sigma factor (sigma-70 family)
MPAPVPTENLHEFEPTQWTLLLQASQGTEAEREAAWDRLCRRYWKPLWHFARWAFQLSPEDAEDATQGFLSKVARLDLLSRADPARGRFRSYLLGCMKNHCLGLRKLEKAQRRGGGLAAISQPPEAFEELAAPASRELEQAVDRQWAEETLKAALARVGEDYAKRGLSERCAALVATVVNGEELPPEELAARLGVAAGQAPVERHRFRARLREAFHDVVRDTVTSQRELEAEAGYLLRLLA